MPPRVTYWTGTWDPSREAISKEIALLRTQVAPRAPVVSFSPGQRTRLSRGRVVRLGRRQWPLLRMLAAAMERSGDVTHVFGGVASWHLLRAVGRRPLLLTVALPGDAADPAQLGKVALFAAESRHLADALVAAGVARSRIEVVYPAVDTAAFRPAPIPASGRFRVLFASSPADPSEFDARGIPLLVEAARHCPEADFVFLWRTWGRRADAERAWSGLHPPPNAAMVRLDATDMAEVYNSVHVVACCYADGFGKSTPNSIVEGLACGRPAIVTRGCGIADLIAALGAGQIVEPNSKSIARAVTVLRGRIRESSPAARALAERYFDGRRFVTQYAALYERLHARASRHPAVVAAAWTRGK